MKNIYLICGRSGSGKTTVAELLEAKYGLKSVKSYTTRPRRSKDEDGHIFISKEEFDKMPMVAFTLFDNYEYGVTKDMINVCDLYIIDLAGIHTLKKNYSDKPIKIINLRADKEELQKRMLKRGDSLAMINSRLINDDIMFEEENLINFDLIVDANSNIEDICNTIYSYIKEEENR